MSAKPSPDAGAWSGDLNELMTTWLTGQGSDTNLPESVRFLLAVRRLTLAREREPDCEFDRAAAMVLVKPSFFESPPEGIRRCPLLNTGNHCLTGQLHFVNEAAAGKSLDYAGDDGALFDALEAAKANMLPTIVYSPKAGGLSKLSWYPNGVGNETNVTIIPVAVEEPTADRIMQAINGVYNGHLKTPDQVPPEASPWMKPVEGWADRKAEAKVQLAVKIGLHGRFPHCRILAEQPGKDGRTDIEVVGDFGVAPGAVTHFAVLELKVLREKGSTGIARAAKDIEEHVNDGLNQAYTYGSDRNFRERMLCCFDMRPTNVGPASVFASIKDDAETLGVHLGFWFLYRSSEHYRKCKVAAALKTG